MNRLHSLDGLRAFAVLLVLATHADQGLLPGGVVGVEVFFVLSGYLITFLLLREHDAHGRISLRRFYARRALRLYPALALVVLATCPIAIHEEVGQPFRDSAAALVYVTDLWANYSYHVSLLVHTWSLSVEEQFYVCWPVVLIIALGRGWRLGRVLTVMVAASVVATIVLHFRHPTHVSIPAYLPTPHIAELGSGIWLAIAQRAGATNCLALVAGTGTALIALAALLGAELVLPSGSWVLPLVTVACWPPVAHLVLHQDSGLSRAFSARVPVWAGERSYGIYLWHYPILRVLGREGLPTWATFAVGFGLTLAVTELSWRYVEQPFLRLKRRFAELPTTPDLRSK